MAIKLSGKDIIMEEGISASDAFMLVMNRIDSNRYCQPQYGILAAAPVNVAASTYEAAQYVKAPFSSYTRFNNHAQNALSVEDGHLLTYDGFRYFLWYRYHENVSTPAAANVSTVDDYQRLFRYEANEQYVATGRERHYLPTYLTATNYLFDSNKSGFFSFLNQPGDPIDFELYISSVASTYKFERFEFLYVAVPLEME